MTNFETYKNKNKYLVGKTERNGYVIEARVNYASMIYNQYRDLNKQEKKDK